MSEPILGLVEKIRLLELELEAEIAIRGADLRYGLERGRVAFEEEVRRRHKELKTQLWKYVLHARPLVALTAPIIYILIVPLAMLDVSVNLYQAICFPAYGLKKVRRRDYFVFDRNHLAYLNLLEKFNCAYCSYATGTISFVQEVVARTESYWCPIKHARRLIGAHAHYRDFVEFGDAEAYRVWLAGFATEVQNRQS
jgi:hypothetical protein